jgi:putative CocE/NonD family hydrolase
MRRLILFIATLAGVFLLPDARAQSVDSLPLGWRRHGRLGSVTFHTLQLDRQVRHGGAISLRIQSGSASSSEVGGVNQRLLADDFRGRRMRLSGWARIADAVGGGPRGTLWMRIDGSAEGVPLDNMLDRALSGTADWQRFAIVLDVPADATRIAFGALLRGAGTLWIDDLEFSAVDRTVPTTGTVGAAEERPVLEPDLPRAPRNLDFEDPPEVSSRPVPRFDRRTVMIPMRDGVRLFTVIAAPQAASEPLPILLERTPYGTNVRPDPSLVADEYIFVSQDIRGRNRSEGAFVMNRPARDPRDSSAVDETTDAYDTVEWLIHNVPDNNGRVGVTGISYPGWLAEVVLLGPHPAVRAVSPQAPMTDTWMGDDFFHQGAFRLTYGLGYSWGMEGETAGMGLWPAMGNDPFDWYLSFPSLKALTDSTGAMRIPTWRRFVEHTAYDTVWQRRAFQRLVTRLSVPTLSVGGWWDQEDLYGPQATYSALERLDSAGVNVLVIGPWSHTQWAGPGGQSLGNLRFGSETADSFLLNIQAPWFRYWLKGRGDGRFAEAQLFDAGVNRWRTFDRWPPREATVRRLYLQPSGRLSFDPPSDRTGSDQYVSDPANPVPYQPRPVERGWDRWMTEDQRFVADRPDVQSWRTEPLAEDVTIAGDITARLFASTTGSDADWVVKLIDVYPDSVPGRPNMGSYQLMVAGDIMRGRYRQSWERPEAIRPNAVASYTVDLHQQAYTFRRGHRIMVQIQSTWFPLYDRNPQTYVPNIFLAPASAYRAQTHRIYRTSTQPSHVEVMVLPR